jgi:hypothetical protein
MTQEHEHFMNCNFCGQPFDMRDISQVIAHEHDDGKIPERKASMKKGDNILYDKQGKAIHLN